MGTRPTAAAASALFAMAASSAMVLGCGDEKPPPIVAGPAAAHGTEPGPAHEASEGRVASFAFSEAGRRSLRGGSDEAPRVGGTMIQYVPNKDYSTLNNITRQLGAEETFCRLYLFPPLLDLEPDTLELVPLVAAERPKVSADRRTYTWKLRQGVRWHRGRPDGTPVDVTSADVEFSWRMISNPKVDAARARVSLGPIESVEALDPYTFVVRTNAEYFRTELEFGYNFRLMPAHLAAQDPEAFNKDPLGEAPVGYGPYVFERWEHGQYVALRRNPDWFDRDRLPYWIERLRVHFIPDANQALQLFERGEMSIVPVQDGNEYERMKRDARWHELATFHEYYIPQWNYVAWNHRHPAFGDVRVRRAMTLLHPRELIRDRIYAGHAVVLSGPWISTAKEYDASISPPPFDPEAGKRLLDEAGWKDADGDGVREKDGKPLRFTLAYAPTKTPVFTVGNGWYQEQLAKAGVAMELRAVDMNQLAGDLARHEFDAVMLGWVPDPRDDDLFTRFHSGNIENGGNYFCYASPECDRLLDAFRAEYDDARRREIAHAIHRRIAEDQVCTFLFHPQSLVVVTTKLRNVKMHTLGARWFDWWFAE